MFLNVKYVHQDFRVPREQVMYSRSYSAHFFFHLRFNIFFFNVSPIFLHPFPLRDHYVLYGYLCICTSRERCQSMGFLLCVGKLQCFRLSRSFKAVVFNFYWLGESFQLILFSLAIEQILLFMSFENTSVKLKKNKQTMKYSKCKICLSNFQSPKRVGYIFQIIFCTFFFSFKV